MEPNKFELISAGDREQRNRLFEQFRASEHPGERQVVKFTQTEEMENGLFKTFFYVAYPNHDNCPKDKQAEECYKQKHGSARNPRKFPGRKVAA